MKKTACIYTSNTGVGLVADVDLLQDLLHEYYDVDVLFFNWKNEQVYTTSESTKYDLGIFLQEIEPAFFERAKHNVFLPNEEWLNETKINSIREFDKVICKSTFSQQLLSPYNNNVVNSGFISRDKFDPNIQRKDTFLHLGLSLIHISEPTRPLYI